MTQSEDIMTDNTTLERCPFCGAGARLENRGRGYVVMCDQRHTDCQMNMRTHHYDVANEAITAWNTRQSTPLLEAVKEARPYVDAAHAGIDTSAERMALKAKLDTIIGEV